MLEFPEGTQRWFLERSAGEGERKGCSWTGFDQLVGDRPQQLVDLEDWIWHVSQGAKVLWGW